MCGIFIVKRFSNKKLFYKNTFAVTLIRLEEIENLVIIFVNFNSIVCKFFY
ncbi:hypothetical protein OENI_390017 [Oenococcus oeni]|nr:hypothetical protein OENI_390017 [Oenococcus oeni]SYW11969.1 hypothetical protein OENI_170024 [Oenococcus oeni]SYW14492.1 hypothetical protein OENI_520001 [Oenococcus oeni]